MVPVLDMVDHKQEQEAGWHTGEHGEEPFQFVSLTPFGKVGWGWGCAGQCWASASAMPGHCDPPGSSMQWPAHATRRTCCLVHQGRAPVPALPQPGKGPV
jgi:hypothetical protein